MKKLLCLLLLFASLQAIAQPKDTVNTVSTQTSQIIDKVFDRTTEAIQQISSVLKVPAEHVYQVLIKQQRINAVCSLLVFILAIITCYLFIISISKSHWGDSYNYDNSSPSSKYWIGYRYNKYATFTMVYGIIFVISFIYSAVSIEGIFTGLFNPEYGAIQNILSILR